LIAVDGGVMHAAVGLQVPTLALFGPTDPRLWFPYEDSGPFRVLATRPPCHPCDRHACDAFICLPDLAPATVVAAARDLFDPDPSRTRCSHGRADRRPEVQP
jgi:ADP-heptose:LPS heptosyltransferase